MYHYVRPVKGSKYPNIKALEFKGFLRQLNYLQNNFNFVSAGDLLDSIYNEKNMPQKSIILTFDDGFKDHYSYVFPQLKKLSIQGLFFPSAEPIEKKIVLEVHKIQFILACCENKQDIINLIFSMIKQYKSEYELRDPEQYFVELATHDRFDTKEKVFIKRILQRELPKKLRTEIINCLFEKFVTSDERTFALELYLSLDEIKEMREGGMCFGSHAYSHEWLGYLSIPQVQLEIEKSLKFHSNFIDKTNDIIMCYPYGNYNSDVINQLKDKGFKAGLTTEVGDAVLSRDDAFTLKRFDTNDFPQ